MTVDTPKGRAGRLLWAAAAGLSFGQAHLSHGLFAFLGAAALGMALQQPPGIVRRGREWIVVGVVAQAGVGLSCWGLAHYGWAVYAATVGWLALGGALFGSLLVAVESRSRPRPALVALSWMAAEYVMTLGPWSFPLFLGGTQAHLPWRSGFGLVGALGVGAVLVGLAVAVVQACTARGRARVAGAWLAGFGGVALLGAWQPGLIEARGHVDVALVQGGAPNWLYEVQASSAVAERLLEDRYFDAPAELLAGQADLVILPETALRRPALLREGILLDPLFAPAPASSGYLLTGAPRYQWSADEGPEQPWNAALLFRGDDAESVVGVVDKVRLVPIVETRRWARGDAASPLPAGDVSLGVLICYESMDPWLARERASGADLLVILTNDAGFEESPIGVAHARQGWSRAVEQGRPLLRAAQAGISLVVSASGTALARAGHFEGHVLRASVAPTSGWTWFSLVGPFLGPGAWLVLIALAIRERRR